VSQLSAIVTNNIVPAIEQVSGVSNVTANGTVTPALEVTVDPNKLSSLGFTNNDVVSAIQANNVRAPGGIAYLGNHETSIDVRGDVTTPQSIERLLLTGSTAVLTGATSPSGTINQKYTGATGSTNQALALGASATSGAAGSATNPFSTSALLPHIGDVAGVTDGYEPKRVFSYVDAHPSISLNVQKSTGASEVQASRDVIAALPAIERQYPDIGFKILNVQADYTEQQLFGVLQTLVEGIIFTGVAMVFFLRSWRNAVVVMIAIPTSLFVTFFVMKLVGYTIDTVSLLAMTLIIGILVDDSIVVLENVERHYEDGEAPRTAAILGRSEIGMAAVVITLVDVVVFLPIAFLPGQTGRFLSEFGVVVVIATLTSLATSFTVTPSLAGNWSLFSTWRIPRLIQAFGRGFERTRTFYCEHVLSWALRHKIVVAAISAALTIGAVMLIPLGFVGFEFIPAVDRGQIFVQVQFPTGTPLTITDAAVRTLSSRFLELPDVQTITSTSGSMQAGFGGGVNLGSNGQLSVFLKDDRKKSTTEDARIMTVEGHKLVPNARVVAIPATGTRGGNAQPIDITVTSTRGEPDAYAQQVLGVLEDTPGTANVNSSALNLAPQINVEFNRDRARALDLDIGTAAAAVRAAFGGTLATQFDTDNGTKYVQVLYPLADQTSEAILKQIALRTRSGGIVHLGDVAVLQNSPAEALITRVNRQTVIHIASNVQPGFQQSNVVRDFQRAGRAAPAEHRDRPGGGRRQPAEPRADGERLGHGAAAVVRARLSADDRALQRLSRPAGDLVLGAGRAVGAFGSLALTHQSLNLFSLIGVIMLVGLVSKNGILLVDFAILKVEAGLDKVAAIRQAARERFRPIVMTTVSMIAGMMPLALALDPGSEAKRSLGTVVIGGLTSSLLLTLVLVPSSSCGSRRARPRRSRSTIPSA
jgi:HAE1 family hydrophobic/amphiphilic exporter-1